jgi:hypothetical protein
VGFNKGFEKVSGILGGVGKAIGSGIKGAAQLTSGSKGLLGIGGLAMNAVDTGSKFKKYQQLNQSNMRG